jgi:ATP-dependent helicase/nuclease subunit A
MHDALRNIERSDIGTVHSFAATLLRLYPLEAGLDPQFDEDDGEQFDRLFDEQWGLWLDRELSAEAGQPSVWKTILGKVALDYVKALAKSLCSEAIELGRVATASGAIPAAVRDWLTDLESRAAMLMCRCSDERVNEQLVRAALMVIRGHLGREIGATELAGAKLLIGEKTINRERKGWSEDEINEAQDLVRAAKALSRVDAELTVSVGALLVPFASTFRELFVREGLVSFDGLLIRARNLLRDHLRVREQLKRQYRAILIDEFQDTDPIQYEIMLYLGEQPGAQAREWRKVKLTPGKIFVVGDPKQSIYAFRRADIEAYLEVVDKIIKAQDGVECRLTTNFRSNGGILDAVNGVFASLMQERTGIQPPYIAINPAPGRPNAVDHRLPMVAVRKIVAAEAVSAQTARRLEGESLACWLQDEVLGKMTILSAAGESIQAQSKDVAILFRKLTDIHDYLEPFRRYGIRYVVEGERHFYGAKEIIDAVNLFRAIENPHDRLALVGVLRSPLGGLTDRQIYDLHRANALDYRNADRLDKNIGLATVAELYRLLARLHAETRFLPVGDAIGKIFATLPLKLLAACYFHGEQAVANLEKLRQQAILLGREGLTTLKEAIRQLQQRVLDLKEEGESVLAEENVDAVRIMSIHKAKGLEFPIAVLAGCQTGTDGRVTNAADALFDWSTELTGLRVGPIYDLPGLFITEKARRNAAEEQKRVLYVAMTRAREHLMISCAPTNRRTTSSFLSMLDESFSGAIEAADTSKTVQVGMGSVNIQIITQRLIAPGRPESKTKRGAEPDWRPFFNTWAARRARYESALRQPLFVTPTLLKKTEEEIAEAGLMPARGRGKRTTAMRIGDAAHALLQSWNFTHDPNSLDDQLEGLIGHELINETQQHRAMILAEIKTIFRSFFRSKIYAELAAARILAREMPLLMPWNGQIMEGVIDVIYEQEGLLYLADYKTDKIEKTNLNAAARGYIRQAQIYSQAVSQSLGREPSGFKIIFLRPGKVVELSPEKDNQGVLFR